MKYTINFKSILFKLFPLMKLMFGEILPIWRSKHWALSWLFFQPGGHRWQQLPDRAQVPKVVQLSFWYILFRVHTQN